MGWIFLGCKVADSPALAKDLGRLLFHDQVYVIVQATGEAVHGVIKTTFSMRTHWTMIVESLAERSYVQEAQESN
jgi:hypothetical protein